MKTSLFVVEHLESRQFLSVTPAVAELGSSFESIALAATVTTEATLKSVTYYAGTATNQSDKTSKIALKLTDIKGTREGVIYVNNSSGSTTPVSFTINSKLRFTFQFTMSGKTSAAEGKLSANGKTISGTWTTKGVDGSGKFTATRT